MSTPPAVSRPSAPPAPSAPVPERAPRPGEDGIPEIRLQLVTGLDRASFHLDRAATLRRPEGEMVLPAGSWEIVQGRTGAAPVRYHVFARTFPAAERAGAHALARDWRNRGYPVEVVELGGLYFASGEPMDNRVLYVSLNRFDSETEADALRRRLAEEQTWTFVRAERLGSGPGELHVHDSAGQRRYTFNAPVTITPNSVVTLMPVQTGYMHDRVQSRSHAGALAFEVGAANRLEVYETIGLEDYVAAVLPAEMPVGWPAAALEAQAIAARSEILAQLGVRHGLEGFDFVATELARAYGGEGRRHPATDAATAATRGRVLRHGTRVALALYSSNCGGWTEDNDFIWNAAPDPVLRGVADTRPGARGSSGQSGPFSSRLAASGAIFNCGDAAQFAWSRTYSVQELTNIVNARHNVGAIREIKTGERGVSGRLARIEIFGNRGSAVVERDLPIRQALGGLPSSAFEVRFDGARFTFRGRGFGHGVGMCQHGAKGLAGQGYGHEAILKHYYPSAVLDTLH